MTGLMMGWRGETRELAMSSAYSMETLMPVQFLLPTVRYCPALAEAAAKFVRCVLSNFQLFYADGSKPLFETQPDLTHDIPYEKLVSEMNGHTPACLRRFQRRPFRIRRRIPLLAGSADPPDG